MSSARHGGEREILSLGDTMRNRGMAAIAAALMVGGASVALAQDARGSVRDRVEDRVDRREDVRDRRENFRDQRKNVRDRREDVRDRRENVLDRRENARDRREDRRDSRPP